MKPSFKKLDYGEESSHLEGNEANDPQPKVNINLVETPVAT